MTRCCTCTARWCSGVVRRPNVGAQSARPSPVRRVVFWPRGGTGGNRARTQIGAMTGRFLLPRCRRGTRPGDDRRGDLPRRVLQGCRSQQRRTADAQPLVAPRAADLQPLVSDRYSVPARCGIAKAAQRNGNPGVVMVWGGEGSTSEGDFP